MEVNKDIKKDPVIDAMFKAGAHFGFLKSRRHPSVKSYIYGAKNKIEIFDLEKTKTLLDKALAFVEELAKNGKQILIIGGKNEAQEVVKREALSINMPYVAGRFIGGTLTNFPQIKKRVDKLQDYLSKKEKGEFGKYTKKERLLIDKEISNLEAMFSGIVPMTSIPGAIFVVDSKHEAIAVEEAKKVKLPVVSLSGSDCDISKIDYPIVGNDASMSSISFFLHEIAEAYRKGAKNFKPVSKEIRKPEISKIEARKK